MCASAIFPVRIGSSAGHIGLRIVGAMLVLDVHAVAELLEVEAAPIDPDLVAYPPGFLARRSSRLGHLAASRAGLRKHPSASLVVGSHPTIVTPERQRPAQGRREASA